MTRFYELRSLGLAPNWSYQMCEMCKGKPEVCVSAAKESVSRGLIKDPHFQIDTHGIVIVWEPAGLPGQSQRLTWDLLIGIYTPVVRRLLGRFRVPRQEMDDLVQEVFKVVVLKSAELTREQRTEAFEGWLRVIVRNGLRNYWRRQRKEPVATGGSRFFRELDELEEPGSKLYQWLEQEHDQNVLHRLLERIKPRCRPRTWQLFQRVVLEGACRQQVADEFGITVHAVVAANARVLRRLRREGAGCLE